MKRLSLLFALIIALCSTNTFAQTTSKWGIYAGTNLNKAESVIQGASNKTRVGFDIAAKYQLHFSNGLFLDLGLGLDKKAVKTSAMGESIERNALGIQTPIHLGYMYNINNKVGIFATAGTYMTFGMSGEYKGTLEDFEETAKQDLYESGSGDNRFEMGLGLKLGVQIIKHIQISVGYDFGLTELNKDSDGLKNRTFNLGVAYMF